MFQWHAIAGTPFAVGRWGKKCGGVPSTLLYIPISQPAICLKLIIYEWLKLFRNEKKLCGKIEKITEEVFKPIYTKIYTFTIPRTERILKVIMVVDP